MKRKAQWGGDLNPKEWGKKDNLKQLEQDKTNHV